VPAEVVNLARVRQERNEESRDALPLVVESEPGAVRVVIGDGDDEVELGLTPALADAISAELARAARAARGRRG
jgi:hypothetical protein